MPNTEHYYSTSPTSAAKKYSLNIMNLRGLNLTLTTAAGVFSPKKLDNGTRLLIESAYFKPGWNILDIGCGYGIIGIIFSILCPNCKTTLIDINRRAVALTRQNIEDLSLKNAQVLWGNLYEPLDSDTKYHTIVSNPPQASGKSVCSQLIREAPFHLKDNGLLQIVGRQRKGGKFFLQEMREAFGNVDIISRKGGYSIYVAFNQQKG